jgi:CRP-like cAMP-binding protein
LASRSAKWKNAMWITILGYLASASVLLTFCMTTMIPLRVIALVSNVLFASFGALAGIYPVMLLHLILFPVNVLRLMQNRRLVKNMSGVPNGELSIDALIPFMTRRTLRSGEQLTRQGDRADRMFYLVKGEVEVQGIGKTLGPGSVVGEIGVFARNQARMATVVCLTDCEVFELKETKAKEIYFQNPAFGYAVLQIIISRLTEDLRLSEQGAVRAAPAIPSSP